MHVSMRREPISFYKHDLGFPLFRYPRHTWRLARGRLHKAIMSESKRSRAQTVKHIGLVQKGSHSFMVGKWEDLPDFEVLGWRELLLTVYVDGNHAAMVRIGTESDTSGPHCSRQHVKPLVAMSEIVDVMAKLCLGHSQSGRCCQDRDLPTAVVMSLSCIS